MRESSGHAAALSPERRALFEALLREEGLAAPRDERISRRQDTASAPLSFAQQRLWFLDQFHPNSSYYNIPTVMRLTGRLDVTALEASINEIVRRHEALRTTFPTGDGDPVQVIVPRLSLQVPVLDLTALPEAERETAAQGRISEEAERPFDLAAGPLLRATVLRLAMEEHLLVLTTHHIVSDAWSRAVLVRELGALYGAFLRGEPSPLPDLPIQYADFALWQRQWLQGEVLEQQIGYWRQRLADAPAVLDLPADHPRPAVQSFRGSRQPLQISRALTDDLHRLSREEGATLFMTLLAAFQTLLFRYTGQEDLVVGTPIANRTRAELEGLIGFFVNTLVLRTNLSGRPTFRKLLGRVREVALGAYAHQDLPFEKLVEELQPERSLSHTPLFQVMFALQNAPSQPLILPGLRLTPQRVEREIAKSDLGLYMGETPNGLVATIEYNSDLFDAATIRRLSIHFQTLLEGIVADPDRRLSEYALLSNDERCQLLDEWNDTGVEDPEWRGIHQSFEAQVARTPEAAALVAANERLTYGELNRRANQLAHHLRAVGVGPEVRVALCLERSPRLLIGLLAILKAGGAYVPLDPIYPPERLGQILTDCQAELLLTETALLQILPHRHPRTLCLDEVAGAIALEPESNLDCPVDPRQIAYVLYTSGSTGRPKGVAVPQQAVVNFLDSMRRRPGLDEHDVLVAVTTLAFDIAALELFLPLTVGARVVLASPEVAADGVALAALLRQSSATVMQATPATWQMLLQAGWSASDGLKLLCGGEALQSGLAARLLEHGATLWNLYGPTETTIWSAIQPVTSAADDPSVVTIGRPIANTQTYVLDRRLRPVPIGVAGELYIGGAGVARGYLNRPELTAEKFIPHPYAAGPGERLYRTGDLARYRADGNLEFLGRLDHQVKVRGFRIELGEIEGVLSQHPAVRECVVAARGGDGVGQLVAYLVPREAASEGRAPEISISELRRFAQAQLPEYMVPTLYVVLEALPLTANGKVDRKALPAPDLVRPEQEKAYQAPRDALEIRLTQVWEKVLGVHPIGVRDDFFHLGGHSLLAVRLFSEMQKACGKSLPLALLFQAPTIEQLADLIRQEGWQPPWSSLVAIQPAGSRLPLFCVHGAGGHVLAYRHLAEHLGVDQPVYGIQARGLVDQHAGPASVEELATHYLREIRSLQPEGPYLLGGFSLGGYVAYEMARQLYDQGQEVATLFLLDVGGARSGAARWTLRKRIRAHLHLFLRLRPRERLKYLGERVKAAREEIREAAWRMAYRKLRSQDRALPRALRDLQMYHREALRGYRLQPFPGRVTVFRATERGVSAVFDAQMGWGRLALGGVEIHDVPGDHATLVKEPHVRVLAEKLGACLTRVQQEYAAGGKPPDRHPAEETTDADCAVRNSHVESQVR